MARYAIIKDGVVNNVVIANSPLSKVEGLWICVDSLEHQPGPRWLYDGEKFSPPPFKSLPPVITKAEFRFRLTDEEYVGILSAAKTDVEVQAWVETFNMSTQIMLDDPRTVSGLEMMVGKGLLTENRKKEILGTSVDESERP